MEREQAICTYLLWALQKTRSLYNLRGLRYEQERETVVAQIFRQGIMEEKEINVAGDSGIQMIKDIIAALE